MAKQSNDRDGGEKVAIALSEQDRDLILQHTFLDSDQEAVLRAGIVKGSGIIIRMTLEDLDDLLAAIAFSANHADSLKYEIAMGEVYDRLRMEEDRYLGEDH